MKHCPRCRENYSDEHENCFTCNVELVEGGLAEPTEAEREEALRRKKRGNPLVIAGLVGFVFCIFGAFVMHIYGQMTSELTVYEVITFVQSKKPTPKTDTPKATNPRGPQAGEYTGLTAVHLPEGQALLSHGGLVRTGEEAKAFEAKTGITLPSFAPGTETLVYCPVAFYSNTRGSQDDVAPTIYFASQQDDKVNIGIGRKPPGGKRESAVQYDNDLKLILSKAAAAERTKQFVVVGRLGKISGRLNFLTTGQ